MYLCKALQLDNGGSADIHVLFGQTSEQVLGLKAQQRRGQTQGLRRLRRGGRHLIFLAGLGSVVKHHIPQMQNTRQQTEYVLLEGRVNADALHARGSNGPFLAVVHVGDAAGRGAAGDVVIRLEGVVAQVQGLAQLGGGAAQKLVEDVVVALAGGLVNQTRLLEQVLLNGRSSNATRLRELNFNELKKKR